MLSNVIIIEGISGIEPEPAANMIAQILYHTGSNIATIICHLDKDLLLF